MAAAGNAITRRFGAVDLDAGVVQERMEQTDGVAAAAHAGADRIRQAAVVFQHLRTRFAADDGVEIAHHARIRIRAGDGADDVEGVLHVADPVAHRFIQRVLERGRARGDRDDLGPEQLHAVDVDLLPFDVGRAHVDHAFQAQPRRDGGTGHAMLAGAGLGDDAGLAHAAGQQRLADGVVDLVRAGVVQVFALEQDLRPAHFAAQPLGVVDRTGATDVMLEILVVLGNEGRVLARQIVGGRQFLQGRNQGFRDEAAAKLAEMAGGIRIRMKVTDGLGRHGSYSSATLRKYGKGAL